MSKHTPTPWQIRPSHDGSGDVGITADGLPNVLAETFADIRFNGERETAEAQANAAFIIRAVNSHDDLVKALEEISRSLGFAASIHNCGCPHPCDDYFIHPGPCPAREAEAYSKIKMIADAALSAARKERP